MGYTLFRLYFPDKRVELTLLTFKNFNEKLTNVFYISRTDIAPYKGFS